MPITYQFAPRWREELVCSCADGTIVLEFSMGSPHVYFPSAQEWPERVPEWAKSRRAEILAALQSWCAAGNVALTIDEPEPPESDAEPPAINPEPPAIETAPRKASAPIGAVIVVVLAVSALWVLSGHWFLKYRLEGSWRSVEPLPHLILVLRKVGSYDWGPQDPRKGNMQHGRWRVEASDTLEFIAPGADLHVKFQLLTTRSMNKTLVLDSRWYLTTDR